jgi:hypothetical protein
MTRKKFLQDGKKHRDPFFTTNIPYFKSSQGENLYPRKNLLENFIFGTIGDIGTFGDIGTSVMKTEISFR